MNALTKAAINRVEARNSNTIINYAIVVVAGIVLGVMLGLGV